MLKIDYTYHSLERLKERHIFREELEEAILKGIKSSTESGLRKSTYRNEMGWLTVIYSIKSAEEILIITAYRE